MANPRLILDFLTRGHTHAYGPDRSQTGELYLPVGAGPHPVMVVIHGGSWHKRYGRAVMRGLVGDLVRRGWAAWNIEYRRLGNGGGWPETFTDVADAIDHLVDLPAPLDLDHVSVLGHSAGGHLAVWAAGREGLPADAPGAQPRVRIRRAIAQAGVLDLEGAYRLWRGGAVKMLMGGSPEQHPDRYRVADPMHRVPLKVPVLAVHGVLDEVVSIELARAYRRRAEETGGSVALVEIGGPAGSHRAHINPSGRAWRAVTDWLVEPVEPVEAVEAVEPVGLDGPVAAPGAPGATVR